MIDAGASQKGRFPELEIAVVELGIEEQNYKIRKWQETKAE
jgi:hypothetical protein